MPVTASSPPSAAAVLAVARKLYAPPSGLVPASVKAQAASYLNAAHDPALGLDRSVRLRDIVEALRNSGWRDDNAYADHIEHLFAGVRSGAGEVA